MTDEKRHLPKIDPAVFESPHYQQQHRIVCEQIEVIAMPFAPHFDPAKIGLLADALISEQLMLTRTLIPAMVSPAPQQPDLGIHVWSPKTSSPTERVEVAEFEASKRLEGIRDPDEALAAVLAFAFVHLPVARALLRMHGFTYRFTAPTEEGTATDEGLDGETEPHSDDELDDESETEP